jgi:hypothetical protein
MPPATVTTGMLHTFVFGNDSSSELHNLARR